MIQDLEPQPETYTTKQRLRDAKQQGLNFREHIKNVPPSREASMITTKIEEALLWLRELEEKY